MVKKVIRLAQITLGYLLRKETCGPPMKMSIEPTNICNFKCSFCGQSHPKYKKIRKGMMQFEQVKDLLGRIVRDFYPDVENRLISFTHRGEPFLNKQFPDFIILANKMGFKVNFSSNGSLVDKQVVDYLVENEARYEICVDFAADDKLYETIRGGENSHTLVLRNLEYLIGRAMETKMISVVITDISTFNTNDQKGENEAFENLKALFNNIEHKNVKFTKRTFHSVEGVFEVNHPEKKCNYRLCYYPWFEMRVAWCGDVIPCARDWRNELVMGNVFELDSLWDLWLSEQYQCLRRSLIEKYLEEMPACRRCDLPFDSVRWSLDYVVKIIKSKYFFKR